MESSFNGVELRELQGSGGRRGPTPTSAPWTAAAVGRAGRGFENASYEQDEERDRHQQEQQPTTSYRPPTSGNRKVSAGRFGAGDSYLFGLFLKQYIKLQQALCDPADLQRQLPEVM